MKKILLTVGLCMLVTASFAQKKAIKDAKSATSEKKFSEARELIKPALTDAETANDPDAWKTAGDVENKQYEDENLKQLTMKSFDEKTMYNALSNSYDPYIKADQLGQVPDEKGKVKNKVRKDITSTMRANHGGFVNGGIYFNSQQDYPKASEMFEKYWMMPSLEMFVDQKDAFNTSDSTFQVVKYYAAITAIQAKDAPRSIMLLKKITEEPFAKNSTYKESDVYELLASQYQETKDSVNLLNILEVSSDKFPDNKFFIPNLINQYIRKGQSDKAIAYLDKAIASNPSGSCDMYSVKASLFAEKKDYTTAEQTYELALKSDPNCERALEGVSVLYIVQAQNIKEEAGNVTIAKERAALDDKAKTLYKNAIPLLEKYKSLLLDRKADETELKPMYVKLQNVYYNLNMDKEMEEASAALEKLAY